MPTVDFLICFHGLFIAIEAKKPGGKPTQRQDGTLEDIRAAGGVTFVVDDDVSLDGLRAFLNIVKNRKTSL